MKAHLKLLHSPDYDLDSFTPADPQVFGLLLQAFIGPENDSSHESFDFFLCTPKWLDNEYSGKVIFGTAHIIVTKFDIDAVRGRIEDLCESCSGSDWTDIAQKIARFGRWEFQDYQNKL